MMNEQEAGQYWNQNAPAWTALARAGYDVYRDHLNTPAFFDILPDICGLDGLDIGCGEGHNTRMLAQHGARMHAIDIAPVFVEKALESEAAQPLGIAYAVAGATSLPFGDAQFDFATSFMCLMDMPEPEKALQEAFRVLKPGGFFQFSISHPCFNPPHRKSMRRFHGPAYAVEVGDYFNEIKGRIDEWIFGRAPAYLRLRYPKFKTPVFHKTLGHWFDAILDAGFVVEKVSEPRPGDEALRKVPALESARAVAYFLHFRCRKPVR